MRSFFTFNTIKSSTEHHSATTSSKTIGDIIRQCMDKKKAIRFIQQESLKIPSQDQPRFIEVVETELMSLHEENIARYRLRPSEYVKWQKIW